MVARKRVPKGCGKLMDTKYLWCDEATTKAYPSAKPGISQEAVGADVVCGRDRRTVRTSGLAWVWLCQKCALRLGVIW